MIKGRLWCSSLHGHLPLREQVSTITEPLLDVKILNKPVITKHNQRNIYQEGKWTMFCYYYHLSFNICMAIFHLLDYANKVVATRIVSWIILSSKNLSSLLLSLYFPFFLSEKNSLSSWCRSYCCGEIDMATRVQILD